MTANAITTPAGQAKVLKTQRRVLDALTALTTAAPPVKLTVAAVCREAGISPDALALAHHAGLKKQVERAIAGHNAMHFGGIRRKTRPASDVAMVRIERLEQELADLRGRYDSAVQSLRTLATTLDDSLAELERLRQQAVADDRVVVLNRTKQR